MMSAIFNAPRGINDLVRRTVIVCVAIAVALQCGCIDPVNDSHFVPAYTAEFELSQSDSDHYRWTLSGDNFVVTRPPSFDFLTSRESTIETVDPVTADLVPWPEDTDPEVDRVLRRAFGRPQTRMTDTFTIERSKTKGLQACDLSYDGTRLITIDDDGLTLYETDTGSRIGAMKFPDSIANPQSLDAVRFCSEDRDFLVAAPGMVYRIDHATGMVTAAAECADEAIVDWQLSPYGQHMVMQFETGKLYNGDIELTNFGPTVYEGQVITSRVALSPDGSRFSTYHDGAADIYHVVDGQVDDVESVILPEMKDDVRVCVTDIHDLWTDGVTIHLKGIYPSGNRYQKRLSPLWHPALAIPRNAMPRDEFITAIGKRFLCEEGREEVILYDQTMSNRNDSNQPIILDSVPDRLMISLDGGDTVALLDSTQITIGRRPSFHSCSHWDLKRPFARWIDEERFDRFETLMQIACTQNRYAYGYSGPDLCVLMGEVLGDIWQTALDDPSLTDRIAKLERWRSSGDQLAIIASFNRSLWLWIIASVQLDRSEDDAERKKYHLAAVEQYKLMQQESEWIQRIADKLPPAHANYFRDRELTQADDDRFIAFLNEYPTATFPFTRTALLMMERHFGEPGDAPAVMQWSSRIYDQPYGDALYAKMFGRVFSSLKSDRFLQPETIQAMFDDRRLKRGVREYMRRNMPLDDDFRSIVKYFLLYREDKPLQRDILSHIMKRSAMLPTKPIYWRGIRVPTRQYGSGVAGSILEDTLEMRAEAGL